MKLLPPFTQVGSVEEFSRLALHGVGRQAYPSYRQPGDDDHPRRVGEMVLRQVHTLVGSKADHDECVGDGAIRNLTAAREGAYPHSVGAKFILEYRAKVLQPLKQCRVGEGSGEDAVEEP